MISTAARRMNWALLSVVLFQLAGVSTLLQADDSAMRERENLNTASALATLVGFAELPADTFAEGPPSGAWGRDGLRLPDGARFPAQPMQGVSSLVANDDGTVWALSDNGFGTKWNSVDALLLMHHLRLHPRIVGDSGEVVGEGSVEVLETVRLSDPDQHIRWPILNENTEERVLTGWDFDPESMVRIADGTFWIGEEFGPFLLNVDATGKLLREPVPIALVRGGIPADDPRPINNMVMSPQHPSFLGRYNPNPTLSQSRGLEGLAVREFKGNEWLFPMLEGSVRGDPAQHLRILSFQLHEQPAFGSGEIGGEEHESPLGPDLSSYPVPRAASDIVPWFESGQSAYFRTYPVAGDFKIGELEHAHENTFLVIERDSGHGPEARWKKVFAVELSQGRETEVDGKRLVVDLLNIADPHRLASEDGHFTFPFVTIESILVLDRHTLLLCNDNNFPATGGREEGVRDDTEFIWLRLHEPLWGE